MKSKKSSQENNPEAIAFYTSMFRSFDASIYRYFDASMFRRLLSMQTTPIMMNGIESICPISMGSEASKAS